MVASSCCVEPAAAPGLFMADIQGLALFGLPAVPPKLGMLANGLNIVLLLLLAEAGFEFEAVPEDEDDDDPQGLGMA